jgi:hypothetical protein
MRLILSCHPCTNTFVQEQVLGVITKYGSPDKILAVLQGTADKAAANQARIDAVNSANQAKIDAYTKLKANADSYATSVQNIIGLSKAIANPQDAAQKNANLQASLDNLASETKFLGIGGTVSAAEVAGSTYMGASSLGGYSVSQNVAAVVGGTGTNSITTIPVYGTVLPGTNGGMNVATNGAASGTLFAPTTYVDNTTNNATNVNAGGNDNVRDTYSHPILGSTERSVSSTYNYNYLYR